MNIVVQSLSRLRLCNPTDCSTPGFPVLHISWSLPKLTSIESMIPSNHLILCHPLLLLPSIFPSIRVFFSKSALHIRWPKYWSFSFSSSPSSEYSELIPFRIGWCDFLDVQGTLKSLLQHHNSKASILQPPLKFTSHLCMWLLEKHRFISFYSYPCFQLFGVNTQKWNCSVMW